VLAAITLLTPSSSFAQFEPGLLSVPAPFVRQLALPGEANDFLRPSAIFIDRAFGEVLVADPGNGRITVLDDEGTFKFEFGGDEHFVTPSDVVVDSQGRIYVLGSTLAGHVIRIFDFDGVFLETQNTDTPDGPVTDIGSIALDRSDNLYLLDQERIRICSYDREGRFRHAFALESSVSPDERRKLVFGSIEVTGEHIFVPVSSIGTVAVHDPSGRVVRYIGHKGNNPGEMNFPVDVAVRGDLIMVLDKMRFNVICFTAADRFLGEFGGKGMSPGWFYHPTLLDADDQGQVYIGQIFQNKIQVCRIPEFILNGVNAKTLGPDVRGT
jgi:hypothetical protein